MEQKEEQSASEEKSPKCGIEKCRKQKCRNSRNTQSKLEKTENKERKKDESKKEQLDDQELIRESGQISLSDSHWHQKIHLLSVIREIEGHECLSSNTKTTKYEHVLPKLAEIEDSDQVDGVLVLLNTVGGDVGSGLAIAEMLSSLSKPTVSLVLGGSHFIGVPLRRFQRTILLLCHREPWSSIRCV